MQVACQNSLQACMPTCFEGPACSSQPFRQLRAALQELLEIRKGMGGRGGLTAALKALCQRPAAQDWNKERA